MPNKNFLKKPLIFQFIQEPSKDCQLTKSVKTISYVNNSKNSKEQ